MKWESMNRKGEEGQEGRTATEVLKYYTNVSTIVSTIL